MSDAAIHTVSANKLSYDLFNLHFPNKHMETVAIDVGVKVTIYGIEFIIFQQKAQYLNNDDHASDLDMCI